MNITGACLEWVLPFTILYVFVEQVAIFQSAVLIFVFRRKKSKHFYKAQSQIYVTNQEKSTLISHVVISLGANSFQIDKTVKRLDSNIPYIFADYLGFTTSNALSSIGSARHHSPNYPHESNDPKCDTQSKQKYLVKKMTYQTIAFYVNESIVLLLIV